MSCPHARVGLGQGREGSGTARHNILANASQIRRRKHRSPGHPSHEKKKLSTGPGRPIRGSRLAISIGDLMIGHLTIGDATVDDPTWNGRRDLRMPVSDIAKRSCIINVAVGIAQLAEHRTVAPTVAGSIPVSHPRIFPAIKAAAKRLPPANPSDAKARNLHAACGVDGSGKTDSGKFSFRIAAPEGAIASAALSVCLKAYPDTNLEVFRNL